MRNVAVVTDSSSSLPAEIADRHRIFVVPLLVQLNGHAYYDGVDLAPADVYRYMANNSDGALPTTSAPSTDIFVRTYMQAAQEARNILSIHVSSTLSATYQVACLARELIDTPVHVLDSRTAAMSCGFAVLEAARLAETDLPLEQVAQRARQVVESARFLLTLDRLDYLHRGGRVPAIAALAGAALKLCPILSIEDGQVKVLSVARTRRRALNRIVQMLERRVGSRPVHVAIMHADVLADAQQLLDEITQRFDCVESFITEFTPVMGTHTGPGLLGLAYFVES